MSNKTSAIPEHLQLQTAAVLIPQSQMAINGGGKVSSDGVLSRIVQNSSLCHQLAAKLIKILRVFMPKNPELKPIVQAELAITWLRVHSLY